MTFVLTTTSQVDEETETYCKYLIPIDAQVDGYGADPEACTVPPDTRVHNMYYSSEHLFSNFYRDSKTQLPNIQRGLSTQGKK